MSKSSSYLIPILALAGVAIVGAVVVLAMTPSKSGGKKKDDTVGKKASGGSSSSSSSGAAEAKPSASSTSSDSSAAAASTVTLLDKKTMLDILEYLKHELQVVILRVSMSMELKQMSSAASTPPEQQEKVMREMQQVFDKRMKSDMEAVEKQAFNKFNTTKASFEATAEQLKDDEEFKDSEKALRILCANLTNRLEMLEEGDLPTDPPAHLTFEKACEVMKALVLAPQQEQVRVMKEGADDMDSFIDRVARGIIKRRDMILSETKIQIQDFMVAMERFTKQDSERLVAAMNEARMEADQLMQKEMSGIQSGYQR